MNKLRIQNRYYLPSLDGLRAISIILVVLGHSLSFTAPAPWRQFAPFFDGAVGVRIFFVISGFLITNLLLAEKTPGDGVSLRGFYIRRTLRLAPVQLCFIAMLFVLTKTTDLTVSPCQFATALTYTKNYACGRWVDGHLCSLSVEEQFYLLWPTLLLFLPRRWAITFICFFIFFAPISRAIEYHFGNRTFSWLTSNADALLIGCMATLALRSSQRLPQALAWRPALMRTLAVAVIITPTLLSHYLLVGWFTVMFGPMLQALSTGYLILSLVEHRQGLSYRILNAFPLSFIGRMSYSLYVWQQPFFASAATYGFSQAAALQFPLNILLAFVAGTASYFLIERPMARLRARFRPIALEAPETATPSEPHAGTHSRPAASQLQTASAEPLEG